MDDRNVEWYDTIMSTTGQPQNRVKARRLERGWAQAELARRAGISRAAVSAIEINRLVPSVAAALALAAALGCAVEDLFGDQAAREGKAEWAWLPQRLPCRYWQAQVGGRNLLFPAEASAAGVVPHDGLYAGGPLHPAGAVPRERTLVLASCDPAVGLLATELSRGAGVRLLAVPRSSRQALRLLGQGLVHAAGVHLGGGAEDRNARSVSAELGAGYELVRAARWQEGLAVAPAARVRSVRQAVATPLRWVGREPGSGARECLDELRPGRGGPRHQARDHRGVAEAVRCGWADVGVCLRLASEEAGLDFLPVREEAYDLCYASRDADDPRLRALVTLLRSASYRRLVGDLPGYDTADAGEVRQV